MKKLLAALTIAPMAIASCGGGGNSDSGGDTFSMSSTETLYAGTLVGEEARVGQGKIKVFDGSEVKEVTINDTKDDYEVIIDGNIDTSKAGTYDVSYKVKKGNKTTANSTPLKYTVIDPASTKVAAADTTNGKITAKILYLQVSVKGDRPEVQPATISEEYRKQMEELYNNETAMGAHINFEVELKHIELPGKIADYKAEWDNLPSTDKTGEQTNWQAGVSYHILRRAIEKVGVSSIQWDQYDSFTYGLSRVKLNDNDYGDGLAGSFKGIKELGPVIDNVKLKDPMKTFHKKEIGLGYNMQLEAKVGDAADYGYKTMNGLKWTLSNPQISGVYQPIVDSEVGSKNLGGDWDYSRLPADKFPTIRNNSVANNRVFNAISTLMHETVHTFGMDHSYGAYGGQEWIPAFTQWAKTPWKRNMTAKKNGPDGNPISQADWEKNEAKCSTYEFPFLTVPEDTNAICEQGTQPYEDKFDNMSSAEFSERWSTPIMGQLFDTQSDRVIPTTTASSHTIKSGVSNYQSIVLENFRKEAQTAGHYSKDYIHTLDIEYMGDDPVSSHLKDYSLMNNNLEGLMVRYTTIDPYTFQRHSVLLDASYLATNNAAQWQDADWNWALGNGKSITFGGVKLTVNSVSTTAGINYSVQKV